MTLETWLAFVVAAVAISLSPGAGAVASLSSGLRNGFPHGVWTALGQQLGLMLQLLVVAIGLGAVLAASGTAFEIVRWCGVAYLLWLGVQQWRLAGARAALHAETEVAQRPAAMVAHGFLVNAVNPKATVFMLAVLPQFIDPVRPLAAQYGTMAATMVAVDIVVMGGYTLLAARLLAFWRDPKHLQWVHRGFGMLFVGAAALLATFRRSS
ncbi:LysE family transporter [Spiribacter halobius]|uniref:Threonine transporter RhtB n=1 Tax=Sediminicurvatus halobius TaxID=2182432 RepID=A0A2U2N2R8_9GAMM|nr:LysE family transporter [Spiribacter halobius]PWG63535.1 threonine transporter RhtB [Spiribacter halobius]UEX79586.1 LysE family transporter [Spiribacter halobius]